MGHSVYANGMEISAKSSDGKSIACFPDVCFTPPQAPPTPPGVPIPYPNTGMASDTTNGSRTVQIGGKEVMLKDQSYYKTSYGDEAGCAPKKGVMTSKIKGKIYFTAWSMNVKFEALNVVRHMDLTTHNHGSNSNTAPWVHTASMTAAFEKGGKCENMEHLRLRPYKPACEDTPSGAQQTGHHLIPGRCMGNNSTYNHDHAPVICVSRGNQYQGSHQLCHEKFDPVELDHFEQGKPFTYATARKAAAASAGGAMNPPRELDDKEKACVEHQLDQYYTAAKPGCTDATVLRASAKPGKAIPAPTSPAAPAGIP